MKLHHRVRVPRQKVESIPSFDGAVNFDRTNFGGGSDRWSCSVSWEHVIGVKSGEPVREVRGECLVVAC